MNEYKKAIARVNGWIADAEKDNDKGLARNLKKARDVLNSYFESQEPTSEHNSWVMSQYRELVRVAMQHSNSEK